MNVLILSLLIGLPSSAAEAAPIPFQQNATQISGETALKSVPCSPVIISESGPISNAPKNLGKELAITLGDYKFIRTDIGDPDGELKVFRGKKLVCHMKTSLLTGIRLIPSSGLVLTQWSSGSGKDWELFQTGPHCASLGIVPDKDAAKFESSLTGSRIKTCE
jgi:hypothetical protein